MASKGVQQASTMLCVPEAGQEVYRDHLQTAVAEE